MNKNVPWKACIEHYLSSMHRGSKLERYRFKHTRYTWTQTSEVLPIGGAGGLLNIIGEVVELTVRVSRRASLF